MQKKLIGMGIEGTAHTFGIGIVTEDGKILANMKAVYEPESGGIHPREASRHQIKVAKNIIEKALTKANLTFKDIDFIAFSQGPGLVCF